MLTFKEFQEKAARTADKRLYLPLEQQKECYKWYLNGAKDAGNFIMQKYNFYRDQDVTDLDDCIDFAFDDFEEQLEVNNAETEEN